MEASKVFKALAAALGLLGLTATTAENLRHFYSALEEYYWYVLAVAWILSTIAAWPQPSSKTVRGPQDTYHTPLARCLLRYVWIILVSMVFLAAGFYRYRITYTPEPGDRPVIKPGEVRTEPSHFDEWPFGVAYAQSLPPKPRLLQFNLISEKTSYIKTDGQYDLPRETLSRVAARECDPSFSPVPALRALRDYAKISGKASLLRFLGSEDQLRNLIRDHPARAKELIPTKADLDKMNPSDHAAIMSWMRSCVGILFPVFAVVIENPLDHDLVIVSVRYHYYRIIGVTGVQGAGPLYPTAWYVHKLEPRAGGSQQVDLQPGSISLRERMAVSSFNSGRTSRPTDFS